MPANPNQSLMSSITTRVSFVTRFISRSSSSCRGAWCKVKRVTLLVIKKRAFQETHAASKVLSAYGIYVPLKRMSGCRQEPQLNTSTPVNFPGLIFCSITKSRQPLPEPTSRSETPVPVLAAILPA